EMDFRGAGGAEGGSPYDVARIPALKGAENGAQRRLAAAVLGEEEVIAPELDVAGSAAIKKAPDALDGDDLSERNGHEGSQGQCSRREEFYRSGLSSSKVTGPAAYIARRRTQSSLQARVDGD